MTDQELIEKVRKLRPADLSDGMDAIGLVNTGTMSCEMRPLRPGISMAGFAYTVKLVPAQEAVKACETFDEYMQELGAWCEDAYAFTGPLQQGEAKDKVLIIDMGGYPGGLWGSEIGMNGMKWGLAGVVIDGAECTCVKTPLCHGYAPLIHIARTGQHTGIGAYARSKTIPSAASRFIRGIRQTLRPTIVSHR